MDCWKEAYYVADIAFENSWIMWIVYISFFTMALVVRKKENSTRRITGNVMIAASIPGILMSAGCLGLFICTMVKVYQVAASNEYHIIGDSPVVRALNELCNSIPITCLEFSVFLFFILALIAIICGMVILIKRAGRRIGIVTLLYGLALILFSCWLLKGMMLFWAS